MKTRARGVAAEIVGYCGVCGRTLKLEWSGLGQEVLGGGLENRMSQPAAIEDVSSTI